MARVGCRWPGGVNLHIKKHGVSHERWPQFRLQGPPGKISSGGGDPLRSARAAHTLRNNHLAYLTEMKNSKDKPLHEMNYVENHVPDHFWKAWVAQQGHTHLHEHKVVFEIK